MVMLEAKVLWVVDHDFEHEGFSCGGVICDAFASAVLGGGLVCVFKQPFSVFKQHFTCFHTLFHPHVFPQIFTNDNFQFLNTYTKRGLRLLGVFGLHLNIFYNLWEI